MNEFKDKWVTTWLDGQGLFDRIEGLVDTVITHSKGLLAAAAVAAVVAVHYVAPVDVAIASSAVPEVHADSGLHESGQVSQSVMNGAFVRLNALIDRVQARRVEFPSSEIEALAQKAAASSITHGKQSPEEWANKLLSNSKNIA